MRAIVAAALAAVALVAGCGGDEDAGGDGCLDLPQRVAGSDAKAQLRRAAAELYAGPVTATTSSSSQITLDRMPPEAREAFQRYARPTTGSIRIENACRWEIHDRTGLGEIRVITVDRDVAVAVGPRGQLRRAGGDARKYLLRSSGADRDPVRKGGIVRALGGGRYRVTYGSDDATSVSAYFAGLLGDRGEVEHAEGEFTYDTEPAGTLTVDGRLVATIDYGRGSAGVRLNVHYEFRASPNLRIPAPRTEGTVEELEDLAR